MISKDRLREAYNANPDGCGFMWKSDLNVEHFKGCWDFDQAHSIYEMLEDFGVSFVVHFRTASSGSISEENCHPFYVNDKLAFVENGNLYEYSDYFGDKHKDNKTDIQRFNDDVLKKLPDGFIHVPNIRKALEYYCKRKQVKMIFMNSNGTVDIVNEVAGEWVDGCWYSNGGIKNYIGYGYSGAYYYNKGDVRHKGGLFSVQMLPEERRKDWSRCPECLGYFKDLDSICSDCVSWGELLKMRGGTVG